MTVRQDSVDEQGLCGHGLVLFDGVCNLCHASVKFIIPRDPKRYFYFASLQSETARQLLAEYAAARVGDSLVLIEQQRIYVKSSAALRIVRHLRGLWPICYAFIVIPRPWRDAVYDFVARHRYKWFSRLDVCPRPDPADRQRFLEP